MNRTSIPSACSVLHGAQTPVVLRGRKVFAEACV